MGRSASAGNFAARQDSLATARIGHFAHNLVENAALLLAVHVLAYAVLYAAANEFEIQAGAAIRPNARGFLIGTRRAIMWVSSLRTNLARLWREDEGLLTFEYVMLGTVLVVGSVGAASNIRDSINSQATGLSNYIRSLDEMRPAMTTAAGNGNGSANGAAVPNSADNLIPVIGLASYDTAATNAASPSVTATALSGPTPPGTAL
jgi:hypothetical protein